MSKVAVIGNTARAIGAVCAADLTLSGHEVRFTVFPEQKDRQKPGAQVYCAPPTGMAESVANDPPQDHGPGERKRIQHEVQRVLTGGVF